MRFTVSPDELSDKAQDISDAIEHISDIVGDTPDFLERIEASEVAVTEAALVMDKLSHAMAEASMELKLIRAKARREM